MTASRVVGAEWRRGRRSSTAIWRRRKHVTTEDFVIRACLWIFALLSLSPLLLILTGSVRDSGDLLVEPFGVPTDPTVENYVTAWTRGGFDTYMVNSLLITVSSVALCAAVSVMVAYVLGRWRFRGRALLTVFFLSGLMLPIRLGAVPIYGLFQGMGLIDSRLSLVLMYAGMGIPLAVFISTAFFRHLPNELEEAARLDGAGEFRVFWSVMLPLARPVLATVCAITCIQSWHEFFFPLILMRSPENFTVTIGLSNFVGQYNMDVGPLYAGIVLSALPLLILFAVASRQIVSGLTAGIGR